MTPPQLNSQRAEVATAAARWPPDEEALAAGKSDEGREELQGKATR